jgi:hypothetical protein
MNIYWLQEFWFFQKYYTDTSLHKHYFTIEFPKVDIDAQIWLTIFSPGVNFDQGVTGIAAAGVKSYRFVDQNGVTQYKEPPNWDAHVRVQRCTEITFAFHVRLAWAKAEGIIYWHD